MPVRPTPWPSSLPRAWQAVSPHVSRMSSTLLMCWIKGELFIFDSLCGFAGVPLSRMCGKCHFIARFDGMGVPLIIIANGLLRQQKLQHAHLHRVALFLNGLKPATHALRTHVLLTIRKCLSDARLALCHRLEQLIRPASLEQIIQ